MKFQSNSIFNGTITANSVANAGVNTNKFLVLNSSGLMTFRTAAEVLADIGASASGLPVGGTAGQILAKIDATNYNAEWIDNYSTQVKNFVKLGATLSKGTAVYVSSADGTNMIVSASTNATEAGSSKTLGLLETGGATNDIVKVITYGLLAGLDTSTATAGDPVWLGTNGGLIFGLANKPVAPAHMVYIGTVTRVQSNNGEIFVNVQNGFEMGEIHNYLEGSVQNNQVIVYESATSLYKPKSIDTILGYTPVTSARTLTINGTTYDLSANRSWTIDSTSASTRTIQKFTADGSSATYTITGGYAVGMVDVFINGIKLDNATEFTASNGTTVVIASTPASGDIVEVYKYGSQFIATNALRQKTLFTATAGQTTFTVTYSVGLVDVFYNGSKLDDTEYTATNGTSIVFNTACVLNDKVEVIAYTYNATGFTGVGGSGTAGYLSKWTASGTLNNSLIYDNGTNVGINTTTVPVRLTIATTDTRIEFDQVSSTVNYLESINTGRTTSTYFSIYSRGLNFWTRPSGTGTYAQTMTLTDAGNVGIGTNSPANYFTTTLTIDGSSSQGIMFRASGTDKAFLYWSTDYVTLGANTGGIVFKSNDTERMRLISGGKLLLGTTTDNGPILQVSGSDRVIELRGAGSGNNCLLRYSDGTTARWSTGYNNGDYIIYSDDTSAYRLLLGSAGLLTIPSLASTYTTSSGANMYANPANGQVSRSTSSIKYKKNVQDYTKGLNILMQLRPVSYEGKSEIDAGKTFAGFIAEEIHDLGLTEFVQYAEDGSPDALSYQNMVALLTKAIQEQQAQIEQLKQLIN